MKKQRIVVFVVILLSLIMMATACSSNPTVESDSKTKDEKDLNEKAHAEEKNEIKLEDIAGYWHDPEDNLFLNLIIKGEDVGELIYHYPEETMVYTFKQESAKEKEVELMIINEVSGKENIDPYTIKVRLSGEEVININNKDATREFTRSDEKSYKEFSEPTVQLKDIEGYWFNPEYESFMSIQIKEKDMGEITYHNPEENLVYTFNQNSAEGAELKLMIINSNIDKVEEPYEWTVFYDNEDNIRVKADEMETSYSRSSETAYEDYYGISEEQENSQNGEDNGHDNRNIQSDSEDDPYDPYEWAPGVRETFEKEMVESQYADSVDTIRYEKSGIYNNQGYYEVYAEMDGVEYRIVTVNVKTGYYHG